MICLYQFSEVYLWLSLKSFLQLSILQLSPVLSIEPSSEGCSESYPGPNFDIHTPVDKHFKNYYSLISGFIWTQIGWTNAKGCKVKYIRFNETFSWNHSGIDSFRNKPMLNFTKDLGLHSLNKLVIFSSKEKYVQDICSGLTKWMQAAVQSLVESWGGWQHCKGKKQHGEWRSCVRSGQVTHGDRAGWAHSDNYDSARGWLCCYYSRLHVFRISASHRDWRIASWQLLSHPCKKWHNSWPFMAWLNLKLLSLWQL